MKLFYAITKEILLLKRDRAGLLILFLMPAVLVVVITLVQVNVMELTGQNKTELLFLDLDGGELGKSLSRRLETGNIKVVAADEQQNIDDVEQAVGDGDYQAGIILPQRSSERMHEAADSLLAAHEQFSSETFGVVPVRLLFDPGILPGLRTGITAQVRMSLETITLELKVRKLTEKFARAIPRTAQPQVQPALEELPKLMNQPLLFIEERANGAKTEESQSYNPVQQNVVAWALFGMFFSSLPIAGAILEERKTGIWIRLSSLPVSRFMLFSAKVLTYTGVCLCQFLLICLIGTFLFPFLGLPAFSVSQNPGPVLVTVIIASMAVCGFGIFLGIACNTFEQAFTVGASATVTAAAIGGVMVPVYAMPDIMQHLSIISPINWGLTALQELLVRGAPLSATLNDLIRLALFSVLSVFFSWKLSRRRA